MTIWPGEFAEVTLPKDVSCSDATFALEPRTDAPVSKYASNSDAWPQPTVTDSIAGKIHIANLTNTVRILRRNEHFCQIWEVFVPDVLPTGPAVSDSVRSRGAVDAGSAGHSSSVQIDPDGMLSADERSSLGPLCKNTTMCSTRTTAGTTETLVPSRPSSTWGL